jgi:hypothetical protein
MGFPRDEGERQIPTHSRIVEHEQRFSSIMLYGKDTRMNAGMSWKGGFEESYDCMTVAMVL